MTRAVIKQTTDIAYAMPIMERAIEGCAYSEKVPIAAFRYKKFGVIINNREILITNAGEEASVVEIMNFLEEIVNNTHEIKKKVRTY